MQPAHSEKQCCYNFEYVLGKQVLYSCCGEEEEGATGDAHEVVYRTRVDLRLLQNVRYTGRRKQFFAMKTTRGQTGTNGDIQSNFYCKLLVHKYSTHYNNVFQESGELGNEWLLGTTKIIVVYCYIL